jgi:aminoglycoside phosphotransferase (APT) family kinase protein
MKTDWERTIPPVILPRARLEAALGEVIPGFTVMTAEVLGGGLANTNLAVRCADGARWVVRIYQRAPHEHAKEAAIARLLAGRVPVAEYVHVEPPGGLLEHAWALVRWVDGAPMDRLALDGRHDALLTAAAEAGRILATLQSIRMPAPGFLAPDLTVPDPMCLTPDVYMSWMEDALVTRHALKLLPEKTARRLQRFLGSWVPASSALSEERSLVHSDFNGANILTDSGRILAVIDWEFAFSGSTLSDIGNMLRHFAGAGDAFRKTFVSAFRDAGGRLPENWEPLAAVLDLLALADMLASSASYPRRAVSIVASIEAHLARF